MESVISLVHGVLLLVLSAAVFRQKPPGLRLFAMAVFAASLAPFAAAAGQILDRPEAAYLRWIAVPAAFAFPILLSQSMCVMFRDSTPLWARILLGVEALFAAVVTVYFYQDTLGHEPVQNVFGIWDFPPGAAAIAAGFGAVVFTVILLLAAFAPALRFREYPGSLLLVPAGLLIGAALILRGVLTVRTFARDPHSLILAGSGAALSVLPLLLFAILAHGLEKRRTTNGGRTSSV